jgi:hypothetical protein
VLHPQIYVNFSEEMATVGLSTAPEDCVGNWVGTVQVPPEYYIFTCPTQPFTEGQSIVATASGDDLQGLPLAAPTQWTFTTLSIPPQIILTSPFDGEGGVALAAPIVIDFSEPINTGTFTWNPTDYGHCRGRCVRQSTRTRACTESVELHDILFGSLCGYDGSRRRSNRRGSDR